MNEFLSRRPGPARHGLVVGLNREATTAISRTLAAAGCHVTFHHPVHWPDTVAHLRHAPGDVVIHVCPHARCASDCLVRLLRADGNRRPVLAIAARGSADRWTGCHTAGANVYLAAPPKDSVLVDHVRALTQHSSSQVTVHSSQSAIIQIADLKFDPVTRLADRGKQHEKLTPREAQLLIHLRQHEGQVCTHKAILEEAWHYRGHHGKKVLKMNVARLRGKIDTGHDIKLIHTVPRVGYVMKKG